MSEHFSTDWLRTQIRINYPWFAVLSDLLNWQIDETIPTACTNGVFVKFGPKFMDELSKPEKIFVGLHEIFHIILKHPMRRGDRCPKLFNEACDYRINYQILKDYPKLKMPDGGLYNRDYAELTEYEIFEILREQQKQENDSGESGDSESGDSDSQPGLGDFEDMPTDGNDMTGQSVEETSKAIDDAIQIAATLSKMAGHGGGLLGKIASANRQPNINWKTILRKWLQAVYPAGKAWRYLDRRYLACGVPMPGIIKSGTQELVFAIDCSGSMSRTTVANCLKEIESAFNSAELGKAHVLFFTGQVDIHNTYSMRQKFTMPENVPDGGTCFEALFNYVSENIPASKAVIVLTDLYDTIPTKPRQDILWISTRDCTPPPYGQFAHMNA